MNQSVATRIQEERSRIGLTQEELAGHLGITKAAVSKWECEQSMLDITLLPKLASLFQISIDDLLGHAPTASPEKASKALTEVTAMMGDDPAKAAARALELAHLFWTDASFTRQMAMLLYAQSLFSSAEEGADVTRFDPNVAKVVETLLRRVIKLDPQGESHDRDVQSLCMVLASTGREDEAAHLVEGDIPAKPSTAAVTLAGIQMRTGNDNAACTTLKRQLLFSLLEATSCMQCLTGCADTADVKTLVTLAEGLQRPEHFSSLSPTLLMMLRLELASRLAADGDKERALDELEAFSSELKATCDVLRKPENPTFFSEVQELLWQQGGDDVKSARNQSAEYMKDAMLENLTKDGRWDALREDIRFKAIIEGIASKPSKEDKR